MYHIIFQALLTFRKSQKTLPMECMHASGERFNASEFTNDIVLQDCAHFQWKFVQ